MEGQALQLDGIKWYVTTPYNSGVTPLCPKHLLGLKIEINNYERCSFKCAECISLYSVPRSYSDEIKYVLDKIESKSFKSLKFINLDDEVIPLAEAKDKSEDNNFFVTAKLLQSKVGMRLVVYAGKQGEQNKTQIFVEPEIKRLAFDQGDLHPSDVFLKLEGTFEDGTRASIVSPRNKD